MTIDEFKKIQEDFDRNHAGKNEFYELITESNLQTLEHLVVCLTGELGEFSNLLKKVVRGDFSLATAKPALDEELVDIFIYLLKISNQFNIDIENVFLQKHKKNKIKFSDYKK
jgi:NTP pyrophosphatase (non-canonical NTP hydrolase)